MTNRKIEKAKMSGLKGNHDGRCGGARAPRVRWHNAQSYAEHSPSRFPKGVVDDETAAALPNPTVSALVVDSQEPCPEGFLSPTRYRHHSIKFPVPSKGV